MIGMIKRSIALKVSLLLALVMLLLTTGAGIMITSGQVKVLEDLTLGKAKLASILGAETYGALLEEAIDGAYLTSNDIFDTSYQEVKGYDWGGKTKFHTRYDAYTDRVVVGYQDKFLETPEFMFAVGADINGFVPTHNTIYTQPLTGDVAHDVSVNRTKRMYNSPIELKAATNESGTLIQEYTRDTGAKVWDVSSPIHVKGKHWGGFRIGVAVDEILLRKRDLAFSLSLAFGLLLLVTVAVIFLTIKRSMTPLEKLAGIALDMSTGENLEEPIKAATIDEVGRMAKSLDRLRTSLKAAMSRLGE
jgi:HAMP domain-containing protein